MGRFGGPYFGDTEKKGKGAETTAGETRKEKMIGTMDNYINWGVGQKCERSSLEKGKRSAI